MHLNVPCADAAFPPSLWWLSPSSAQQSGLSSQDRSEQRQAELDPSRGLCGSASTWGAATALCGRGTDGGARTPPPRPLLLRFAGERDLRCREAPRVFPDLSLFGNVS